MSVIYGIGPDGTTAVPVKVAADGTVATAGGSGGGGTSNTTEATQLLVKDVLGATADAAATADTGTFSINALTKRVAQRLTTLISQLPAALGIGAATAALRVVQGQGVYVDRSGSITTGGTAQQLMAANSTRMGWKVQNTSTAGPLYFNGSGTASAAGASFMLAAATSTTPGGYYESPPGGQTVGAVSIFGATTGQTFAVREW